MATALKVEVVSPAKWERLRAEGKACECVTESLGFADAARGRAYVRDTAVPALNKYLVNHEVEHLVEHEATDACPHGFRHKKFFDVVRNIGAVSLAPFTGGASLSAGTKDFRAKADDLIPRELTQQGPLGGFSTMNLEQPLGRTLMGGAPAWGTAAALAGGINAGVFSKGAMAGQKIPLATQAPSGNALASLGTAPGAGGEASGGLSQFIRPLAQSGYNPSTASGIIKGATFSALGNGAQTNAMGTQLFGNGAKLLPGTTQLGGTAAGGGGGGGGTAAALMKQVTAGAGQTASAGAPAVTPAAGASPSWLSKLAGSPITKALALGGGLSAIGDLGAKKPQAPDFSNIPSVQQLQNTVGGKGLSPLGQLGQQQLSARLTGGYPGLEPGAEQSIRDTFAQERRNLISQFKAIRPNADLTSDSAYRQALFELDQQEAQAIGTAKESSFQNFQQTRTQDIAQALGVDSQSVETLAQIAQLDIATIMAQLGVDAAEAQQFKQTWSNLGMLGAVGAMGGFSSGGTP